MRPQNQDRAAKLGRSLFPVCSLCQMWSRKNPSDLRLCGGRYWVRTSDLFRVREARYRCANRPRSVLLSCGWRWVRDSNPCARICSPLPLLSANPPRGWVLPCGKACDPLRADDGIRTRDPHLGKVMRYHCATSALPFDSHQSATRDSIRSVGVIPNRGGRTVAA